MIEIEFLDGTKESFETNRVAKYDKNTGLICFSCEDEKIYINASFVKIIRSVAV